MIVLLNNNYKYICEFKVYQYQNVLDVFILF